MKKKSKIIIARIIAVLMVFSILPFDLLTTANVVMAEELDNGVDVNAALDDEGNAGGIDIGNPEVIGGIPGGDDSSPEGENGTNEDNLNGETDSPDKNDGNTGDSNELTDPDDSNDEGDEADENDPSDPDVAGDAEAPNNAEDGSESVKHIMRPGAPDSAFFELKTGAESDTAGAKKYIDLNGTATVASVNANEEGRFKLGKGGSASQKSVKFTIESGHKASVRAYLISSRTSVDSNGNQPADATVGLYKDGTTAVATGTALCDTSYGSSTKPIPVTISKDELASGTYYLYAPSSSEVGANLYYMEVVVSEGEGGGEIQPPVSSVDVTIDSASASVITSAVVGAGASFVKKDTDEDTVPTAITLTAEAKTASTVENSAAIKAEVDEQIKDLSPEAKNDVKTLYYDLTIADQDDVAIDLKPKSGVITITMPYSISAGASNKNKIVVLHNTDVLKVKKDQDGFSFDADGFSPYTVIIQPPSEDGITVLECDGYEEGAYAEWEAVEGAAGYRAYISKDDTEHFVRIDNELIRKYEDYWRVDSVGLANGKYYIKIEAGTVKETNGENDLDEILAETVTEELTVTNYDRSGFAFSEKSTFGSGSGAYNDDGTLKAGAQVVYVTKETATTCTAYVHTAANKTEKITGFQSILDAKQKKTAAVDIIDFRIIGCLNREDLDHISSKAEGLQVKGNNAYAGMNITIEGIGEDAVVKGFGFLVRNCGNVEMRNFAIMNFMDDGVSLDTGNCNIWLHDLDIFYGGTGSDSDQAKGDGSIDVKGKSTYVTISYNHFWDSGKCSLCGMSDSEEFMVTYHHNWFDHSDSRHPRIRVASVHLYNNYFDGNAKYGVGTTKGSSAFVEANYFRNCKYPMLISLQASDIVAQGIFSGEPGGSIKAYNNTIIGASSLMYANVPSTQPNGSDGKNYDAYLAEARDEQVPATYKTVSGGNIYNNFDTNTDKYDLGVLEENIDAPNDVPRIVTAKAGRLNGGDFSYTFGNAQDTNYDIISELKTKVLNYVTSVKSIGGITGVSSSGTPTGTVVAAPTASKASGDVESGTEITLSTVTSDAKIYYTTDGTTPTSGSTAYSAPIKITDYTVIKAIAIKDGVSSGVVTYTYTVKSNTSDTGTVKAPTANKASGTVTKGTTVTLTNNEDGATVYYTEDGSDPTTNSAAQTFTGASKEFVINDSITIRAAAQKDGEWSSVLTLIYTLSGEGGGPVVSGGYIHNFTTSGKTSTFYTITGNMNSKATSITYNGLTLTAALKMESATNISFTTNTTGTLTLVQGDDVATKIDDTSHTAKSGVITIENLAAGSHTITKDKTTNLYYIAFVPDGATGDDGEVSEPYADVESGEIEAGTAVYLSCDTDDAEIYFTTDNSQPSKTNGKLYNDQNDDDSDGPIIISKPTTLKAIAIKGNESSEVVEYNYTIFDEGEEAQYADAPTAEPGEGTVDQGTTIKLKTATPGDDVKIYYTTDNSDPRDSRNPGVFLYYDGAITINAKTTIKAYTTKPGYVPSSVATFVYKVAGDDTVTTDKYEFNPHKIATDSSATGNISIATTGKYGTLKDGSGYFTLVNKSKKESMIQTIGGDNIPVSVSAPANSKSETNITTYNWRYKFGSTSGSDNRKIEFTNTGKATVTICAYVAEDKVNEHRTVTLDNDSRELTATPEEYEFTNIAAGTHKITANVGDYFILYAIVEEEQTSDDDVPTEPFDAEITADPEPVSGQTVERNTEVTLSWKDSTTSTLYYTLNGTDPRSESNTDRKEYSANPNIIITEDTTIKAAVKKADEYSKVAMFKYTVGSGGSTLTKDSWTVFFKQNLNTYEYEYTGSPIKPEFTVYGVNGKMLVEGSDYTVRYSNNTNASLKWNATRREYEDINTNVNRQPTITIIGRGIITGQYKVNFKIKPKDISNAKGGVDITGPEDSKLVAAKIIIEKGKKATAPVICYNGIKLTARDYDYVTPKPTVYNDSGTLEIKGKGNYENNLKIAVTAVDKGQLKDTVKKFKVTTNSDVVKTLTYTGDTQADKIKACIDVKPVTSGTTPISEGTDYVVVLPNNITDAGNVKVMVIGLGNYSGCTVTKSVRIQPCTIKGTTATASGALDKVIVTGVTDCKYTSTGATLDNLEVKWAGKTTGPLVNGKDYKLAYSGNRAVTTNGKKAKCTISFIGNFKGRITGSELEFSVEQADLKNGDDNIKVVIPDKVCNANANCKSVPYVTVNNVMVKASEYDVTYKVEGSNEYVKNPKAAFGNSNSVKVSVHIEAKGNRNYKKADTNSVLTREYTVWKRDTTKKDLSRARVTFYDKPITSTTDKKKVTKMEYKGVALEFDRDCIEVKIGKDTIDKDKYTVEYINNVDKGRATVIIKAKNGTDCIGCKTQTFTIVSRNIKTGGANELIQDTDPSKVKSIFNIFNW